MNSYSCKPSDHPSDDGMHTLMRIAVLTSGICIDESCTVYDMNMRPSRGNCLVSDSVSSVRAASLNPHVSIPFLRAQVAQVWGSGHFATSSIDNGLSSSENGAHHLWGHCFWFPCLGEQQVPCCIDRVGSVRIVYILQTNVSEDCIVSSVSSPMPKFFSKPWCSLKIFHDDRLV